jgi:hypothetical protein
MNDAMIFSRVVAWRAFVLVIFRPWVISTILVVYLQRRLVICLLKMTRTNFADLWRVLSALNLHFRHWIMAWSYFGLWSSIWIPSQQLQ